MSMIDELYGNPEPRLEPTDPKIFCRCDLCGSEIYEGNVYYCLDGRNYCEGCVADAEKYAERDD